ncbi:UPF0669 protein C6orf120 homolog [Haliotis asinina]|uniref:UPF0669 protein C6orf120 homolog n=1 Tax=Haliotis asinina TaxID=109174 RepID=UPI0035323E0B
MTSGDPSFNRPSALLLALFCAAAVTPCSAQLLLQTVNSDVGAENYTYYRLNRPGTIILQLESIQGDADLFVSDLTLNPTYDDYEAQSVTCGLDIVEIPHHFSRPVGVAIYGHVSYELSQYKLEILLVSDEEQRTYEHLNADGASDNYGSEYSFEKRVPPHLPKDVEEEESPWWTLLVGILKIIVEVLM